MQCTDHLRTEDGRGVVPCQNTAVIALETTSRPTPGWTLVSTRNYCQRCADAAVERVTKGRYATLRKRPVIQ